jgi:hypothetical protein
LIDTEQTLILRDTDQQRCNRLGGGEAFLQSGWVRLVRAHQRSIQQR